MSANRRDDVFSKIVRGELPNYTVYEDSNTLAFLDIFPHVEGQVVVIPKTYAMSKFSVVDTNVAKQTIEIAQKIAFMIEEKIEEVERCIIVIEGLEVDYFHIKLIPRRREASLKQIISKETYKATEKELETMQEVISIL